MLSANMVLTGKYAGQTVNMHGKQFAKGVIVLRASNKQDLDPQIRWVERMCQAFPEGSEALKNAQAHWAKHQEKANGVQHPVQTPPQSGNPATVRSGAVAAAGGLSPDSAVHRDGIITEGPAPGDEGLRASRSGHENAGLHPQQMTAIGQALDSLDPMTDAHWNDEGLPSVEMVANALSDQAINRAAINAVAPMFNREKALEIAAAKSI